MSKDKFVIEYFPIQIHLVCENDTELPFYLGMMLHGVMGWTFTKNPFLYQYLYENRRFSESKQDIVNPYVINPPRYQTQFKVGDTLCFQFLLLGNAVDYREEIIKQIIEQGIFQLGARRSPFYIARILQGNTYETLLNTRTGMLEDKPMKSVEKLKPCTNMRARYCSIQLVTPLRIRRGGELLEEIDFSTIIRNITRRVTEIVKRYGGIVDENEIGEICELAKDMRRTSSSLSICSIDRYSTRRNQKMDFSGLLGTLAFEGNLTPFVPWLKAGELLHIGRNTTFGFGKIQVILW